MTDAKADEKKAGWPTKALRLVKRGNRAAERRLANKIEYHRLFAGGLAILGIVTAVVIDKVDPGWSLVGLVILQLLVAGAIFWMGEAKVRRLAAKRISDRSEVLLDLGHTLAPLAWDLAATAAMKGVEARRQRRQRHRLAVVAAASKLGGPGVHGRACLFMLEEAKEGQPRRMMFEGTASGRSTPPKAEFVEGTPEGDAALSMIDSSGHLFCDDVKTSPPPGWKQSERGDYETFISVTVGSPRQPVGMLTLDAPEVGSLTREDVHMLIVLGHLLGIAEAVTA